MSIAPSTLLALQQAGESLYAARQAAELVAADTPVLVALSDRSSRSRGRANATSVQSAEDAVVKPAWQKKALKSRAPVKTATSPASQPRRMSTNDEKVLAYLKTVLDRRSWKAFTHAAVAQGAGIPLGSVGSAIRRVIALGTVREGQKGSYRLA